MIDEALNFLTKQVNEYLAMKLEPSSAASNEIVLSSVTKAGVPDGLAFADKTLALSLINIEEERVVKEQRTAYRNQNGDIEHYYPEVRLNLYILISANFIGTGGSTEYEEGLKQLSNVITFFQGKHVFTPENSPLMPAGLEKLIVELNSYSFEQQYNFWSVIGTKYLPSVMYKVRLLAFQDKRILDQSAPVSGLDLNLSGN